MVRVALVMQDFPKLSEAFIVNKFWGLLERGLDVHVVCAKSDPAVWQEFQLLQERPELRERVHVTWRSRPRWLVALLMLAVFLRLCLRNPVGTWLYLYRGWPRYGFRTLRRLYLDAELVLIAPDVVHFEFGALAVGRTYLKDLLCCRLVASFRGYDINYVGLEKSNFYQEVWDRADGLHFLGEDLWARARRRGCPVNKLRALIPPAVDPTAFSPEPRASQAEVVGGEQPPLRILSVGRLEWKKGYEYALQVVRQLIDQRVNCEYRIVGAGDYHEAVAFAIHQLGLEERVSLLGALSGEEVKAQMQWADVMLHSAVSEGFCNSVLEAQAMALPVVTTDADGLRENVADGVTGFIVPRRDPARLAARMLLLAQSPELRRQMGAAGRQRVLTQFSPAQQIADFAELYRQVLNAPAGAEYPQEFCDER